MVLGVRRAGHVAQSGLVFRHTDESGVVLCVCVCVQTVRRFTK